MFSVAEHTYPFMKVEARVVVNDIAKLLNPTEILLFLSGI